MRSLPHFSPSFSHPLSFSLSLCPSLIIKLSFSPTLLSQFSLSLSPAPMLSLCLSPSPTPSLLLSPSPSLFLSISIFFSFFLPAFAPFLSCLFSPDHSVSLLHNFSHSHSLADGRLSSVSYEILLIPTRWSDSEMKCLWVSPVLLACEHCAVSESADSSRAM